MQQLTAERECSRKSFLPGYIVVLVGIQLASCSGSGDSVKPAPTGPQGAWRPASAEAPGQGETDAFWRRVTVSGNRLLAMTGLGEIWRSQAYSSGWAKMPWPYSGTPYSWYAEGDTLWVGTENPGRVYRCAVATWSCFDLGLPVADSFMVDHMGRIQTRLTVFSTAYRIRRVWSVRSGGGWDSTLSTGFPLDAPFRSLVVGDTFWAATWESGLWYHTTSDSVWRRQAAPRWIGGGLKDSLYNPRGLAWHNGALWVADWASTVTRMPGGKAPYDAVDNCIWDSIQSTSCRRGPVNIFSLLSYRGRLFSAGYFGASPHVLDEVHGFWIPMEIAGWCWDNDNVCGGKRTWDMVGLGDTLYSASSRFVMKIPLSQVPVFSESLMDRFHWPRDTSFRDSLFRRNNPL